MRCPYDNAHVMTKLPHELNRRAIFLCCEPRLDRPDLARRSCGSSYVATGVRDE